MDTIIEQRICIKFCFKNGISCAETLKMLEKCYGSSALQKTAVYKWFDRFKSGREEVEDDGRVGRPSTSKNEENIQKIKSLITENPKLTIKEITGETQISFGSVQAILHDDLGLKRVAARMVPFNLNLLQKLHRVEVCKEMLSNVDNDPNFIKNIITGDETWVYEYDTQTKYQSSQWQSPEQPKPKKIRRFQSKKKVMLTVFIDFQGVVHHEFLPDGQTVNKEYYLSVMRRLREAIRLKRPQLWSKKSWILHHDNAPSHNALIIRDFLVKNGTITIQQAANSPDLAPCDFFLFSRLKKSLRGTRYDTKELIKQKSKEELMSIPKIEFEKCFQSWIKRWHRCIAADGEYFEGNEDYFDK